MENKASMWIRQTHPERLKRTWSTKLRLQVRERFDLIPVDI